MLMVWRTLVIQSEACWRVFLTFDAKIRSVDFRRHQHASICWSCRTIRRKVHFARNYDTPSVATQDLSCPSCRCHHHCRCCCCCCCLLLLTALWMAGVVAVMRNTLIFLELYGILIWIRFPLNNVPIQLLVLEYKCKYPVIWIRIMWSFDITYGSFQMVVIIQIWIWLLKKLNIHIQLNTKDQYLEQL